MLRAVEIRKTGTGGTKEDPLMEPFKYERYSVDRYHFDVDDGCMVVTLNRRECLSNSCCLLIGCYVFKLRQTDNAVLYFEHTPKVITRLFNDCVTI